MKTKRKTKFMESPFLTIGYTLLAILAYGFAYLIYFVFGVKDEELEFIYWFILIFGFLILPTLILIFYFHRGASIIEISEIGIKKSLFKIFYKRDIKWEELEEMRLVNQINVWLFVSKVSMGEFNYNQLVKRKDTIQMTFSKKMYEAIREYSNKEIIGLNEDEMK